MACSVDNFWLPTGDGATGACWFWPEGAVASTGVLVVPGIIHEQQTMAVGLVALAKELASNGVPTLMIDLAGTAQGTGRLDSPRTGQRWDDEVRSAVHHMRDAGLQHIVVLGVRLGALIAAHATVDDALLDRHDEAEICAAAIAHRREAGEHRVACVARAGERLAGGARAQQAGVAVALVELADEVRVAVDEAREHPPVAQVEHLDVVRGLVGGDDVDRDDRLGRPAGRGPSASGEGTPANFR